MGTPTTSTFLALALLALSAPLLTSAQKCNANDFHCVTKDVYQFCLDGSLTTNTQPQVCPVGTGCSSDCYEPCLANTPCVTCTDKTTFHCVDDHSFQMCTGGDIPNPEVYNCPSNFVCSKHCQFECMPKACPPVTCNSTVRMANPENPKNYYLCQVIGGEVVVTEYVCPGDSKFNETQAKCVGDLAVTTPTTTTTRKPFSCPGAGRFPDPSNDAGYVSCILDSVNGGHIGTYFNCPAGSVFNPTTLKCTARATTSTTKKDDTVFQCSAEGRFRDPLSCTGFILCSETNIPGEFVSARYSCPPDSFFDPESSRCTATRPEGCLTTSRAFSFPGTDFECPERGRHADLESALHYYLCTPADDDEFEYLEAYHFPCPVETCFNPETKKCTFSQDVCMGYTA